MLHSMIASSIPDYSLDILRHILLMRYKRVPYYAVRVDLNE